MDVLRLIGVGLAVFGTARYARALFVGDEAAVLPAAAICAVGVVIYVGAKRSDGAWL